MSVPFFEKGKLLKHGNLNEGDLASYAPIDYILEKTYEDYSNNINFFVIEADTGSGKSYTLPIAFYKRYVGYNVIILQPKILTVTQLKDDFTTTVDNKATKYIGEELKLGVNLSLKYSQLNISCKNKHCLTIGSYGSFIKHMRTYKDYINTYKIIILDEIHEDTPETMELLLYLFYLNRNQRLPMMILTSATLQVSLFKAYFNIPVSNFYVVAGKTYSKEIIYTSSDVINVIDKITELLSNINKNDKSKYDILIFISSSAEIDLIKKDNRIKDIIATYKDNEIIGLTRDAVINRSLDYAAYVRNNDNSNLLTRKRQIILSTNIAETGITVYNLKYVINIGYELRREYIPYLNAYVMYKSGISAASEKQRNGRVGRKFAGIAYNLYTKNVKNKLDLHRRSALITTDFAPVLLRNFNKIKYINNIPAELVYDAAYTLYTLGYLTLDAKYNSDNLYDCISYTKLGYIIDGKLSVLGVLARSILLRFDDNDIADITLNDIKLLLLSNYFSIDLSDIASTIAMYRIYTGVDIKKNTNNDFLELFHKYNELMSSRSTLTKRASLVETNIDKVVYIKHKILKILYETGFDVTHNKKKRMDNNSSIKYLLYIVFRNSFINQEIVNKNYRGRSVSCRTAFNCVTDKLELKTNFNTGYYELKPKYLFIFNFNDYKNGIDDILYC